MDSTGAVGCGSYQTCVAGQGVVGMNIFGFSALIMGQTWGFAEAQSGARSGMELIDTFSGSYYYNNTKPAFNGADFVTTLFTNYVWTVKHTNTTGKLEVGVFYDPCDDTMTPIAINPGGVVTRQVTNDCNLKPGIFVGPAGEEVEVSTTVSVSTNLSIGASSPNTVGTVNSGSGGNAFTLTPGAGSLSGAAATNLVSFFSPTNVGTYGSGSAVTEAHLNKAIDAAIRAGTADAERIVAAVNAVERAVLAGNTNGVSGGSGTNDIDYRPDWGRATNLLSALLASDTNVVGKAILVQNWATNAVGAFSEATAQSDAASAVASQFGSVSNYGRTIGNAATPSVTQNRPDMTFPFLGSTFDLDPLSVSEIAVAAATIRGLLVWALYGVLLMQGWRVTDSYMKAATSARQATTAGTSVLGSNVNVGSAAAMAAVITVVILAIPALGLAFLSSSGVGTYFVAANFSSGFGVWWGYADNYVPVTVMLGTLSSWIAFRFAFGAVYVSVTTAIRFLVGL